MLRNRLEKLLCALLFSAAVTGAAAAQNGGQLAAARKLFNASVLTGKAEYLLQAKAVLTPLATENGEALYLLAVTEYKIAEASLRKEYAALYDSVITGAEAHTAELALLQPYAAEAKVLQAGFAMLRISKNWSEAVALTPLFFTLLAEAEARAPENPRVQYFRGLMQCNTPAMFGGSTAEALKSFLRANALFDDAAGQDSSAFHWCRLETLAWTGKLYEAGKAYSTARFYYTKALALEPDFAWVKHVLLPGLTKAEGGE